MYTLNDYLNSPAIIEVDTINPNKEIPFPAVSVCIRKQNNNDASNERVKRFVEKYYEEHSIEMPQELVDPHSFL